MLRHGSLGPLASGLRLGGNVLGRSAAGWAAGLAATQPAAKVALVVERLLERERHERPAGQFTLEVQRRSLGCK